MAVIKYKVIYNDGTEVEVIATPRAMVRTEERYGGIKDESKMQATYHLAWATLNRAGKEPDDFETWLDKIADIESLGESDLPTTGGGQRPDESSPSAQ